MDNCPDEVLELIFELACVEDAGKTARVIGLVSKRLRSIAGPLEFRSVAVCGLEQLTGLAERFEELKAEEGKGRRAEVRHLFISELTEELAKRMEGTTQVGDEFSELYYDSFALFWETAAPLVEFTSPTLRSLSLIASDQWIDHVSFGLPPSSDKVLGTLHDASFPKLVSLTDVHNPTRDHKRLPEKFISPALPSLRRLRVLTEPTIIPAQDGILNTISHHYLLLDFKHKLPELEHLSITHDAVAYGFVDRLLFGEEWLAEEQSESTPITLPRKLQSVVILPRPVSREESNLDIKYLLDLNIPGLESYSTYPELGQTWYDELLADWNEFRRACY